MNNNNNIRPTFGVSINSNTAPNVRPEVGAIWSRTSKANNKDFLSVKLNIPKHKLQALLAEATGEEVNISLVAFPNEFKETGDSRPNFRIYEELKR